MAGLRRAASSFGRGFADASAARVGDVGADVMVNVKVPRLGSYKWVLKSAARGSYVQMCDGDCRWRPREVFADVVDQETQIEGY